MGNIPEDPPLHFAHGLSVGTHASLWQPGASHRPALYLPQTPHLGPLGSLRSPVARRGAHLSALPPSVCHVH